MPVPLALYAILRQIADLGKEADTRILAFGCLVERPIWRELHTLPRANLCSDMWVSGRARDAVRAASEQLASRPPGD